MIATLLLSLFLGGASSAKEIALSFDDTPIESSGHFQTSKRTETLIQKLKAQKIPEVMIFANPCKGGGPVDTLALLQRYVDAGHLIGNHTCSHPRLDDVGHEKFSQDALEADRHLAPLMKGPKFFRFPYLNEGWTTANRDPMREWMVKHGYRNGYVSVDNDDYLFSFKINQAMSLGKTIDHRKVEALFVKHIVEGAEFYDQMANRILGRSPKHVLLLHDMDATVLYLDAAINALRAQGWTFIKVSEAYKDPMYSESPKNFYAGNGLIAQLGTELTGKKEGYFVFDDLKAELNRILGL